MKQFNLIFFSIFMIQSMLLAQPAKRAMLPADLYKLAAVSDPQVSPDGQWVAYTLSTIDSIKDSRQTDVWMVSWDGKSSLQITHTPEAESAPRWSSDGKYLSFLSSRQEGKGNQLWLMDRRGGEGKRVTSYGSGINAYSWSPDGKKILLSITDAEAIDTTKAKTPKPMVMDRYQFKQDVEGYKFKKLYAHLYIFDTESKRTDTLTKGNYDYSGAVWSPDGMHIAFVSNRTIDPDRNQNTDICVMEAKLGGKLEVITNWLGRDSGPMWSPDGQQIVYTRSTSAENYFMYDQPILAIISKNGGEPKLLSKDLDRPVSSPRWQQDGKSVVVVISDDRKQYMAKYDMISGQMTPISDGDNIIQTIHNSGDKWATLASFPNRPSEVYVFEKGGLRRLTSHADSILTFAKFATVKSVSAKAKDGNIVNGLLYLPSDSVANKSLPLLVIIHGGPVSQDDYGFDLESQILSGAGFAVLNVNYRGSSGRGLAYSKAISGDWGNLEVVDLHAMIDELVKQGIADPNRLGVGGWSYGGILTDYLIATDNRFKAAVSGAGVAFPLALYGVDQYIMQYDNELGKPWVNLDKYLKLSYPFLHADRIKTPTLFMVGEKDFNVPAAGSEQMYQALRSQGVPTHLVIYPGQFHGISVPSYQKHRFDQYIAWFKKYIK